MQQRFARSILCNESRAADRGPTVDAFAIDEQSPSSYLLGDRTGLPIRSLSQDNIRIVKNMKAGKITSLILCSIVCGVLAAPKIVERYNSDPGVDPGPVGVGNYFRWESAKIYASFYYPSRGVGT